MKLHAGMNSRASDDLIIYHFWEVVHSFSNIRPQASSLFFQEIAAVANLLPCDDRRWLLFYYPSLSLKMNIKRKENILTAGMNSRAGDESAFHTGASL
jgi:hypothetical protein